MSAHSYEIVFDDIVKQHSASIYRICHAYLYDASYAADLYQEILLQVWKSLPSYRGAAAISTWVYRIAINTAITFNHSTTRLKATPLFSGHDQVADNNQQSDKESQLGMLHRAIATLGADDRLLITLLLEGLSYKEIAEVSGITVTNTGARISRIKNRLQKTMESYADTH